MKDPYQPANVDKRYVPLVIISIKKRCLLLFLFRTFFLFFINIYIYIKNKILASKRGRREYGERLRRRQHEFRLDFVSIINYCNLVVFVILIVLFSFNHIFYFFKKIKSKCKCRRSIARRAAAHARRDGRAVWRNEWYAVLRRDTTSCESAIRRRVRCQLRDGCIESARAN